MYRSSFAVPITLFPTQILVSGDDLLGTKLLAAGTNFMRST